MRHSTYRYNPTTCRYEPVPRRAKDIVFPVFIFLSITSILFVALLFLHSAWITTEKEQAIQQENSALSYYHDKLSGELVSIKASLTALNKADETVQQKLVTDKMPASILQSLRPASASVQHVEMKELLKKTKSKTTSLLQKAKANNEYFGNSLTLKADDITLLMYLPSLQPIDNKELTRLACGFGEHINPYHKATYFHRGIDYVAPRGTPILASASGKVTDIRRSDFPMGDGNTIEIDHGNGFKTRYSHLGNIVVKPGQKVVKGAEIASIGMSGGSIAPHLHFEVLKNNKRVDPAGFILEGVTSTEHTALLLLAKQKNTSLD